MNKRYAKMNDKELKKICAVCGDIAIARNFGALTCKSCKPFFRRNANKNKVFKCKSGDICDINRNTRKKCRKCRLDKCFAVGMKTELILNDVEKHFRRSLVEENRKRKQKCDQTLNNCFNEKNITNNSFEVSVIKNYSLDQNKSINEEVVKYNSDPNISSEIIVFDQSLISYKLSVMSDESIDEQISDIEDFLTINEVLKSSLDPYKPTLEFVTSQLPQPIPRPFNNYNKKFNELENYKLMELFQVLKPIVYPLTKNCQILEVKDVLELVKIGNIFYEREIINLIKAIKNMNVFEDICENDRIALVKYSCIDILCLRSILCYDFNLESWIIKIDQERAMSTRLDLLKTLKSDIYIVYRNYMDHIIKQCESDVVILDLLTAIALFNPNRPNLINRDIVKLQQHVYLYLLQRYLQFKYRTKPESENKFVKLLNTLISAHILGELEKKYFIEDYSEEYCPLVKEIFDLKYCK